MSKKYEFTGETTEVDGQHHFCQEFGAELFKDGAKWAYFNDLLKLSNVQRTVKNWKEPLDVLPFGVKVEDKEK